MRARQARRERVAAADVLRLERNALAAAALQLPRVQRVHVHPVREELRARASGLGLGAGLCGHAKRHLESPCSVQPAHATLHAVGGSMRPCSSVSKQYMFTHRPAVHNSLLECHGLPLDTGTWG